MAFIQEIFQNIDTAIPIVRTLFAVIFTFLIFSLIISLLRRTLLKRVKSKRQVSNVEIFSRVLKYVFLLLLLVSAFFSYVGSWTGLGLGLGLFSAALGWALQRPITGLAAWMMIITKKPFVFGDRIIIGSVRGDVADIGLTHISLQEIGGIVPSEENSGRIVMVPNSTLFEQNITNYTAEHNEFVLDQVVVLIPYESNLEKAMQIVLESAKKHTLAFSGNKKLDPYVRTYFQPSGINVHVRYHAPAKRIQEISSIITKEIYDRIMKEKDVQIAYPHTEVILKNREIKSRL